MTGATGSVAPDPRRRRVRDPRRAPARDRRRRHALRGHAERMSRAPRYSSEMTSAPPAPRPHTLARGATGTGAHGLRRAHVLHPVRRRLLAQPDQLARLLRAGRRSSPRRASCCWSASRPAFRWRRTPWTLAAFLVLAIALDRLVVLSGRERARRARPVGHDGRSGVPRPVPGLAGAAAVPRERVPLDPRPSRCSSSSSSRCSSAVRSSRSRRSTTAAGPLPQAFYWSRGLLFHGGQIQGIQGNSNLLAMVALLALVVFGIQLADRTVRRGTAHHLAGRRRALTFALTRSSTVIARRARHRRSCWLRPLDAPGGPRPPDARSTSRPRGSSWWSLGLGIAFASRIPALLGKSEDLTGRLTIWNQVIGLAQQRPVFGWGWVSYWAPWVKPFEGLAKRNGVGLPPGAQRVARRLAAARDRRARDLHPAGAHHARTQLVPRRGPPAIRACGRAEPYTALTLLPLLLLAALIAQSFAESRLLIEAGWALLVVLAVKTKQSAP